MILLKLKHFLTAISSNTETTLMMTIIFKNFFKKNVLANIVAQKSRNSNKLEFNSTEFYSVLKGNF